MGLAASAAGCSSTALQSNSENAGYPNVVLIVSDDQGWQDIGYNGSEIRTPNLDALAGEGVILDQFHTFPVCSPTRAALMTGRNPNNFGVSSAFLQNDRGVPLDQHFMPETFQEKDYQTWMFGKWHLGDLDEQSLPNARGFDYFYGTTLSANDYFTHESWRFGNHDWFRNGEEVHEEGYTTTLLTDDAIRKIEERDPERPFFLYLAYVAPHAPLQAPEDAIQAYADEIEDENRRTFAAMVDVMDASIGRLVETLEQQGLRENTLIVFMSDNGGQETRFAGNNGPLRDQKGTPFEGGVRTPAFFNWPGILSAGGKSEQFVHAFDVFPTIASATGVDLDSDLPVDGLDLWSVLKDDLPEVERGPIAQVSMGNSGAVWSGDFKLVRWQDKYMLFNMREDPYEENDLSEQYPELVVELKNELEIIGENIPERPRRRPNMQ